MATFEYKSDYHLPIANDVAVNAEKFDPAHVSTKTAQLNEKLIEILEAGPRWYEVGAEKYRMMRWNGETPLPKPVVLESGVNFTIPSREKGRDIPCRMFKPENGEVKGIYMHIHGGGWVLQSEAYQDPMLKWYADHTNLAVISVGYRLAPEDPFPAGPEDCYDAADYLIANGKKQYGGELMFMGGESAGAHLTALTVLHLLNTTGTCPLRGLLLHFGCFDLTSFLPAVHHFKRPLVIDFDIMTRYLEVFLPNTTAEQRRDPAVSPLYANLNAHRGKLPPAFFTCGTEDPLLDDTVFMAAKWQMAGAEGVTKIYPGAPHGFIFFPQGALESAEQGLQDSQHFILEKLGESYDESI